MANQGIKRKNCYEDQQPKCCDLKSCENIGNFKCNYIEEHDDGDKFCLEHARKCLYCDYSQCLEHYYKEIFECDANQCVSTICGDCLENENTDWCSCESCGDLFCDSNCKGYACDDCGPSICLNYCNHLKENDTNPKSPFSKKSKAEKEEEEEYLATFLIWSDIDHDTKEESQISISILFKNEKIFHSVLPYEYQNFAAFDLKSNNNELIERLILFSTKMHNGYKYNKFELSSAEKYEPKNRHSKIYFQYW